MTKAELVNNIAIQTGYDKVTIMNIVESLMDNVKKSIAREENVYLRGFAFLCRASLSPYYFRARKCLSSAVRNRGLCTLSLLGESLSPFPSARSSFQQEQRSCVRSPRIW